MEKEYRSKNGVPVYLYENVASHGFFLSLFVRAGSIYETEEHSGITHFFEHIAIRNLHKKSGGTLYGELDRLGLEFNASTYNDCIQFYVSGAKEHFATGARILADLCDPLVLTRAEIDTERRRIKAEIREGDEKNTLGAFTASALYEDSTLRLPIVGRLPSVDRIGTAALESFRRSHFTPDGMFFYATGSVGDADVARLCSLIEGKDLLPAAVFDAWPTRPAAFGKRECAVLVKPADYTVLRFNFDLDFSRMSAPEADLLYDMLLSGYDSRFFIEMSEKRGLFYDVGGSVERGGDVGLFQFSFEVQEKNIEEAVRLVVSILEGVKTSDCKKAEDMRSAYVDNAGLLFDDIREFGFTFAYEAHVLGLGYRCLEDRVRAYRDVRGDRIRALARQVFTPGNLTLTVKGNRKRIDTEKIRAVLRTLSGPFPQ